MQYQWIRIDADRETLEGIADEIESLGVGKVKFGQGFIRWTQIKRVGEKVGRDIARKTEDKVTDHISEDLSDTIEAVLKPYWNDIQKMFVERRDDDDNIKHKTVPTDESLRKSIDMIERSMRKDQSQLPMNDLAKNVNRLKDVFFKP